MLAYQMQRKTGNFQTRSCKFAEYKILTMKNISLLSTIFISKLSYTQEEYNLLANTNQNSNKANYWENKMLKKAEWQQDIYCKIDKNINKQTDIIKGINQVIK